MSNSSDYFVIAINLCPIRALQVFSGSGEGRAGGRAAGSSTGSGLPVCRAGESSTGHPAAERCSAPLKTQGGAVRSVRTASPDPARASGGKEPPRSGGGASCRTGGQPASHAGQRPQGGAREHQGLQEGCGDGIDREQHCLN